jgi:hypothetical protein
MPLRSSGIRLHGDASQNTVIFIITAVKISGIFHLTLAHCELERPVKLLTRNVAIVTYRTQNVFYYYYYGV